MPETKEPGNEAGIGGPEASDKTATANPRTIREVLKNNSKVINRRKEQYYDRLLEKVPLTVRTMDIIIAILIVLFFVMIFIGRYVGSH